MRKSNPSKNRRRGKNVERAIAKYFNARRVGLLGFEDIRFSISGRVFVIEVKNRDKLLKGMLAPLEQAEKNTKDPSEIPIAIMHQTNKRIENSLVVLRLKDFKEIIGA